MGLLGNSPVTLDCTSVNWANILAMLVNMSGLWANTSVTSVNMKVMWVSSSAM